MNPETEENNMFYGESPEIFRFARDLRKNMTEAEKTLWERLRKHQLHGYRFKPQHPIEDFIADFYCHKAKLVLEIDGGIHQRKDQKEYDNFREGVLKQFNLKVIRFTNNDVLQKIDFVIEEINRFLE